MVFSGYIPPEYCSIHFRSTNAGWFMLFGDEGVVLLSITFALAAFSTPQPFNRIIFNFSNQVIAGMLILIFMNLAGIDFTFHSHITQLIISLAAAVILYIAPRSDNSRMSMDMGLRLKQTWVDQFSWLAPITW